MPYKRFACVFIPIIAGLSICVGAFFVFQDFYHDDAYISLKYSRNLINGFGPVWNPGERVEGYTNFLHVILVGLPGYAGMSLVTASRAVGVCSFIFLQVFIILYSYRLYSRRIIGFMQLPIPFVWTVASFPLIIWSVSGMETLLFTLLITPALWLPMTSADRGAGGVYCSAILLALASMTRPEGVLFFLVILGYRLVLAWRSDREAVKDVCWFALIFCLIYGSYLYWRTSYYGQILPNTFYVKSGFDWEKCFLGLKYVLRFMVWQPHISIILFVSSVYYVFKRGWNRRFTYMLLILAPYTLYVIVIGGDHMPGYRFLALLIPTLSLFICLTLEPLFEQGSGRAGRAVVFVGVMLMFLQFLMPCPDLTRPRLMDPAAFAGALVGKYISKTWAPGSLVALNTAGSTPYYAPNFRYIDMLGLNDAHIAQRKIVVKQMGWQHVPGHEKGDGAYVLSREPDYIILGPAAGHTADKPRFLSDLEIVNSPDFGSQYKLEQVDIHVDHIKDGDLYPGIEDGILRFSYYRRVTSRPRRDH